MILRAVHAKMHTLGHSMPPLDAANFAVRTLWHSVMWAGDPPEPLPTEQRLHRGVYTRLHTPDALLQHLRIATV